MSRQVLVRLVWTKHALNAQDSCLLECSTHSKAQRESRYKIIQRIQAKIAGEYTTVLDPLAGVGDDALIFSPDARVNDKDLECVQRLHTRFQNVTQIDLAVEPERLFATPADLVYLDYNTFTLCKFESCEPYFSSDRDRIGGGSRAALNKGITKFAAAGRPKKAQFVQVYGPRGAKMTWYQRAHAGVDELHFQDCLKAGLTAAEYKRLHGSTQNTDFGYSYRDITDLAFACAQKFVVVNDCSVHGWRLFGHSSRPSYRKLLDLPPVPWKDCKLEDFFNALPTYYERIYPGWWLTDIEHYCHMGPRGGGATAYLLFRKTKQPLSVHEI